MELDAIQRLIETDEETRKRVEDVHQKRNNLKQAIEEEKKKLSDQAWNEVKQKVTDTKKELDQKIEQDEKENATYFENASKLLQETYDKNKDTWKSDLVKRITTIDE